MIDEAQNLTPSRQRESLPEPGPVRRSSCWRSFQIDNPLLDERTNGLSYAAEKMKGSPLCWQITLSSDECERSALAMDAGQRM